MGKKFNFVDEVGFEKYIRTNGYVLDDAEYSTNYFSSYGTVGRGYTKDGIRISFWLMGTPTRVGIFQGQIVSIDGIEHNYTFLPKEEHYEHYLKFFEGRLTSKEFKETWESLNT